MQSNDCLAPANTRANARAAKKKIEKNRITAADLLITCLPAAKNGLPSRKTFGRRQLDAHTMQLRHLTPAASESHHDISP